MHGVKSIHALVASVALLATLEVADAGIASAQSGTLTGAVLADPTERPVAGAEITIRALGLVTRSDSAGQFSVAGIARGQHVVSVRALGFALLESRIVFTDGQRVEIDFLLTPSVQALEKVEVKANENEAPARLSLKMSGFLERQQLGVGRFVGQDAFEKAEGRTVANVLVGQMPGLLTEIDPLTGRRYMASNRRINRSRCALRVIMDGVPHPGPGPFLIDNIDPATVAGVEFYTTATTPPRFNATGNTPCGTLVIWLKG